jgi:phage terminase large subunit GpA-like protein
LKKERIERLLQAVRAALAPPPRLSISDWAERYRVLSGEASAAPGRWRTDSVPYLRGIMEAVKNPQAKEVVVKAAAQVGKTEFILNCIGYYTHQEPSPQLVLLPTLELAEIWSKDRLATMIRDAKVLSQTVEDPKAKDSSNTMLHKRFAGGHISLAGANSPASLSSRPIRIVYADEVDRMPDSAGSEGNPLDLARKRSSTFHNRKFIATSSPSRDRRTSKIHRLYEASKRHVFEIACPHCRSFIPLEWESVVWSEGKPETAYYRCQECAAPIYDGHKMKALRGGRWRCLDPARKDTTLGFHVSALASPWVTFGETASEYVKAQRDTEKLKVWYNTYLGEPYEDEVDAVASNLLSARAEDYPAEVPAGVRVLTLGVDVQDDRLEAHLIGYGEDWEAWVIGYHVFWGDIATDAPWAQLDELRTKEFQHEWGFPVRVVATAVDSGDNTKIVYDYVRGKTGQRVFAVKGVRGTGKPVVGPPTRRKSPADGREVVLYPLGVDEGKTLLYQRLKLEEPGPGYVHFPSFLPGDYYKQLTAERVKINYQNGHPTKIWELPRHRRNEALDTAVYAHAAAVILNPLFRQITQKMQKIRDQDATGEKPAERRLIKRRDSGGYLDAWRN